jgi:hypothetical protein
VPWILLEAGGSFTRDAFGGARAGVYLRVPMRNLLPIYDVG